MFESRYRVLREIGSGGEGRVFLVRHLLTEKLRAAKCLPNPGGPNRLHELNMMKHLHHRSLPEVIDVFEEEDCVWLILEYIRGISLLEYRKQACIGEAAFSVARQLAEVLCYLHMRPSPILHLDIKPTNLLICRDGTLMLIDFGAAFQAHPGAAPELCHGTPGFAAPEQYKKGMVLDSRTDQYGFGAVLYYFVTGKRVDSSEGSVSTEQIRTVCGREMAQILERCLQKQPERRFSDSRSLCVAVLHAERRQKRKRRKRKTAGAAGFLLLTLLFAAAAFKQEREKGKETTARQYEVLLAQAEGLGFEQAIVCYEQAASLCPEDARAYLHFLERSLSDYQFSEKEEQALCNLLFTVYPGLQASGEELLKQWPQEYGRLSYEIGLAYWYFYTGSGGRTAAARWFERAVRAGDPEAVLLDEGGEDEEQAANRSGDKTEKEQVANGSGDEAGEKSVAEGKREKNWREGARIHAKIAGYYETLGKKDETGAAKADVWTLWSDLKELWYSQSFQSEPAYIRLQAAEEILSCIVMEAGELRRHGEREMEIRRMIRGIGQLCEQEEDQDGKERLLELLEASGTALERTCKDEMISQGGSGKTKNE